MSVTHVELLKILFLSQTVFLLSPFLCEASEGLLGWLLPLERNLYICLSEHLIGSFLMLRDVI